MLMVLFEILASVCVFTLLSFISLILLPSLFGCFGFILFWLVILALVVLFSLNLVWIMIGAGLSIGIIYFSKFFRYARLPNYNEYRNSYPNSVVDDKIICYRCGGNQVLTTGLYRTRGKLRYVECLNCRTWLYRIKVID